MDVAIPGVCSFDVFSCGLVFKAFWRSGGYVFRVDEMCFDALLCQRYELSSTCRFMDVAFLEASTSLCEEHSF